MVLVICHSPKVSPNLCFSENILCAQFVTSHWQRTPLSQEKHVNQQYLGKQINETKSWGFLGTLICVQIVQSFAIWNFSSLQAVMNIYESYQRIVYGQLDHESLSFNSSFIFLFLLSRKTNLLFSSNSSFMFLFLLRPAGTRTSVGETRHQAQSLPSWRLLGCQHTHLLL